MSNTYKQLREICVPVRFPMFRYLAAGRRRSVAAPRFLADGVSSIERSAMAEEVSFYQDTNIHVTNLRAMLQGKTYAMANVTSVSMFTQSGNDAPGIVLQSLAAFSSWPGLPPRTSGAAHSSSARFC